MRLVRLDLRAFGPFTGASLDFSAGAPGGLHVIYGPNEAGKSTALRAVRDLLYGFEHKTPDAYLHRNEDLKLGGLLEGQGGTLYVQRLKRRKDSLVDAQGEPLDEVRLLRLLGGVDRETFTHSFGLDHAELEQHGERMLRGEASVGETLFDAGTGGVDVRRLLETLTGEQEKLFRPRGGKPEINRLLEQHAEARRRSQEMWLLPESYEEQLEKLAAARAELAQVSARVEAARTERHRLLDLTKALPAVLRRAECLAEIASLGTVVRIPEATTARREAAESRAAAARATSARLTEESERVARRLAEIDVPSALLAIGQARADRLANAPGRTRKAREDLPKLEAELKALESEARRSLQLLGRPEGRVSAEELRLSAAARARIRELSNARVNLDELKRGAQKRALELERESDERQAELARLPQPTAVEALARVAALSRSLGDVDTPIAQLEERRGELVLRAEARCSALAPRVATLAALAELPVPSPETLERFVEEAGALEARALALVGARRELGERAVEATAAIKRVHAAGAVPSESDLEAARAERRAAALAVVTAWRTGAPFSQELVEKLGEAGERAATLADRLRREADRVAALGNAVLEQELVHAHEERLAVEQGAHARARATHLDAWAELWRAAQVAPLPPLEMRAWVEQRKQALELWQQARALEPALERARASRTLLETALATALGAAEPGDTLALRVERAAAAQAEQARLASERSESERIVDALAARLAHERRELESAERALDEWRAHWAEAVEPLSGGPEIPPAAAVELLIEMGKLEGKLEQIEKLARRVNGIRRDEAELAAEVGGLAREHGIAFDAAAPDAAADEIVRRFRRGGDAREERARLEGENADREALLATELDDLAEAERELLALSREAGAPSPSELPALEAKSRRMGELEALLGVLEAGLIDVSGGRSVAALVAEAEGADAPRLNARLEALAGEIEELEAERERILQAVASIQGGQHTQAEAHGAEAAQQEQTLGAALGERVRRYATVRVASALLERAIERYRVENQGPILKRAGELFPRLTDDGYRTLRVGKDERGIVAVRADGSELAPRELSTGTRYQLYLALRLASVERFMEFAEPLPLVLDDVTVHVDDARKARTFAVLADMAERVQILFFTHHARDAELAEVASGGRAVLHELGSAPHLRAPVGVGTL